MGYTTKKKMIPLLLVRIMWNYTDESHMISMQMICEKLQDCFESEREYHSKRSIQRLVANNIAELNEFFRETEWEVNGNYTMQIAERTEANPESSSGYRKMYYLTGRLFSDTELQVLCDNTLFSPGLDNAMCRNLIAKIKACGSRYFGSWLDSVKRVDIIKRTTNKQITDNICNISSAIKRGRKVSFAYKKNFNSSKIHTVSPYYLVVYSGKYYLLCNKDGYETIAIYRLDRIKDVSIDEKNQIRRIHSLEDVKGYFDLQRFIGEHPRMTYEKTIRVTLVTREEYVSVIEEEFRVLSKRKREDEEYSVLISSTRTSICNWVINMTEHIRIESSSDDSIYQILCERAKGILKTYEEKT